MKTAPQFPTARVYYQRGLLKRTDGIGITRGVITAYKKEGVFYRFDNHSKIQEGDHFRITKVTAIHVPYERRNKNRDASLKLT